VPRSIWTDVRSSDSSRFGSKCSLAIGPSICERSRRVQDTFPLNLSGVADIEREVYKARWSALFASLVGTNDSGRPVTVVGLKDQLDALIPDKGEDHRKAVDRQIEGRHLPQVAKLWPMAEAIRRCGIQWINGLVALHVAGYYHDYLGVLSHLNKTDARAYAALIEWINGVLQISVLHGGAEIATVCNKLSRPAPQLEDPYIERYWGVAADPRAFDRLSDLLNDAWDRWILSKRQISIEYPELTMAIAALKRHPGSRYFQQAYVEQVVSAWLDTRIKDRLVPPNADEYT
jgi:hypothetical protein